MADHGAVCDLLDGGFTGYPAGNLRGGGSGRREQLATLPVILRYR